VIKNDDRKLFRQAVRDVVPLPPDAPRRAQSSPAEPLPPVPVQSLLDDRAVLRESALGPRSVDDALDSGNEESFLRPGLQRELLRKLRRGHWVVQGELDLHGLSTNEARDQVSEFIALCVRREWRCVRIIHGKGLGSPRREPVLKGKLKLWLARREQVLAYCQAPANQGGGGALLVLLQGTPRRREK
jgi:DNA-nicking Smr family endonuclease